MWRCSVLLWATTGAASVHAETDLYLHSGVRTELQAATPTEEMDLGALSGIRSRLPSQREISKVTFKDGDKDPDVMWTKGATEDKFATIDHSTLQCLAALFSRTQKAGTEQRIACNFFNPQKFIVVIHHKDGTLELRTGPLQDTHPKLGATAASLVKKYGVHGFADGDATWTPEEYAIVDAALNLLSPRELKLVGDVPFVREHKAKEKRSAAPGSVAGLYQPAPGKFGCKITIYDAFTANEGIILGTVEKHYGSGTMALIHELGHAIASSSFRKRENTENAARNVKATLMKKRDDAKATYKEAEAKYKAVASDAKVTQAAKNALIDDLNAKIHAFNALDNDVKKLFNAENAKVRQTEKTGKPAELAMSKLLPQRSAVTLYGRTSPGEAFAEAYMLFKLDPETLKRISPKAHAYFANGTYLDEVDADIKARLSDQ